MIDIFLVPLGRNRYEPYYEPLEDDADDVASEGAGWFARMRARFSAVVRDAEERRHERALRVDQHRGGLLSRVQRLMMSWIAERVAEQRLLWKLRTASRATLHVPAGLDPADAQRRVREALKRDESRHRWLLVVHSIGLVLAAPLTVVPGPNVLGLFFTFTVVSHFLSFRGARRGLSPSMIWRVEPNESLSHLQETLAVEPADRHARIHSIGEQLRLRRLASFVERMIAAPA